MNLLERDRASSVMPGRVSQKFPSKSNHFSLSDRPRPEFDRSPAKENGRHFTTMGRQALPIIGAHTISTAGSFRVPDTGSLPP